MSNFTLILGKWFPVNIKTTNDTKCKKILHRYRKNMAEKWQGIFLKPVIIRHKKANKI